MKERFLCAVFSALLCCVAACSSDKKSAAEQPQEQELAAKVDDWTYTRDGIQKIVDGLSDSDKAKYDTPGGRAVLADELIQEELYYREGLKMGLRDDETIQKAVEKYVRGLIVSEYWERNIKPLAYPSDQEMHDYYENNIHRFTKQPIARAMHIMATDNPDKLREYKRMVESGEEGFTALAQKYSEDVTTREQGGDLGYFNPGGYMRGIGYSDEISKAAFELEVGEISEPIKWRKGWSIVVLTEMRPAEVKPYEECRDEIRESFVVKNKDKVKQIAYQEIAKAYDVTNYLAEEYRLKTRTPEELWNLAQNSTDSFERVRHYEEIVARYPQSEHAAKAMFMAGFVYAEELSDYPSADRAFTRVINEYPESEVAESAKYMLQTMNKPAPKLEVPDDASGDGDSSDGS